MIGQIIRSYLVSLGVQIDKPGFQQADATIRQTGDNIERVTGGMARNFVKASTIIASAMASVTASAVGLMRATAKEDLAMQKYARSMMMSEQAAWNMKKATDALGESINDIALTPELMGRFNKLSQDGAKMMVGGDFKETMKNFRDLMFEFTRLKQEASYALNWVGYYLMKYLQRPLADIKEKFRTFNDMVIKNMSVWTEKIARGIYYVLEVGRHFLVFLTDVGKHLKNIWDSFPDGVKKAIVAITALNIVLSAGPLGRAIMLISTLLLLIDDYYGYMEGKDALLGKYWDKLNDYLKIAKEKWEELKTTVVPILEDFGNKLEQLGTKIIETKDKFLVWVGAIAESPEIKELADSIGKLLTSIKDLGKEVADVTIKVFEDLFQELKDQKIFERFVKSVTDLVYQFKWLVDLFRDFMGIINDDAALRGIIHDFVALLGVVVDLLPLILDFFIVGRVIKFAGWIFKLVKNFGGLKNIIGGVWSAIKGLFDGTRSKGQIFKSFWDAISGSLGGILKKMGKIGAILLLWAQGKHAEAAKKLGSLFSDDDKGSKGGKGSGKESGQGDTDWNKRVVYEKFKAAGYSDEAIAGIMGRVQQEHNFNTSNVEEHWATDANGRKIWVGGYGMFQWNGGRTKAFLEWATQNGLNPQDPGVQADYAIIEAQERGITPERMNSKSVSESATIWTDEWEVGEHGDEQSYAADIYDDIKNGAPWMSATYDTAPNVVTPENVHEAASSNESGQKIGYAGGASISKANRELQLRFDDAKGAMRDRGYDFYIQNATENSIGFTSPAEDWWNIRDVLESYGLSVSHDEHGFYVSLDPNRSNPGIDTYIQNSGFVDEQTANELGGMPGGGASGGLPFGGINLDKLGDVKEAIKQLRDKLPTEYLDSLAETINDITAAGKNAGFYDAMRNGMPAYSRGGSGGSMTVTIDVGGVTINGEGKTNSDVGKEVGSAVLQAAADFFLNQSIAQPRIIPRENPS